MDTAAPPNRKLYQWRSEGGLFRMSLANDSELSLAQQNLLVANAAGKIGIGTASPTSKLHVVGGSITVQGASGVGTGNADFAVRTASGNGYWDFAAQNTNGTFVVFDAVNNRMPLTVEPNAPTNTLYLNSTGAGKLMVATTGRVKVKVDATRVPIKVGDLLVLSVEEGVAMKSVEVDLGGVKIHRPGTIIGKALEPLAFGTGEILVLLSLQ